MPGLGDESTGRRGDPAAVVESAAGPSISLTLAQLLPGWARMMPARRFASRASSVSRMDSCSSTARTVGATDMTEVDRG